jgi:hypothetical protein
VHVQGRLRGRLRQRGQIPGPSVQQADHPEGALRRQRGPVRAEPLQLVSLGPGEQENGILIKKYVNGKQYF